MVKAGRGMARRFWAHGAARSLDATSIPHQRRLARAWRQYGIGLALVAPVLLAIALVILLPTVQGMVMSVQNVTIFNLVGAGRTFVGLGNYLTVFADSVFWQDAWHTLLWTVSNLVVQMCLGMALALLLNLRLRGIGIFRAIALIPWIVPSVVAVLTWRFMYNANNGIIPALLQHLGLHAKAADLLGNVGSALWAVVAESIWKGTPFVLILLLAGLQAIPEELYEAARIDGARRWVVFSAITVPLMKRAIAIAAILTTIFTINNFNSIWLMTGGGPLYASETWLVYAYRTAFENFNLGQGSAVSVMIFLLLAVVTIIYVSVVEREG